MYKINILDFVVSGQSIRLTYFFIITIIHFLLATVFPIRLDISKSSNRMKKKNLSFEIVRRQDRRVVQGLHLHYISALYI